MAAHTVTELRFIPACAGNTDNGETGDHAESVHPRVCGEHAFGMQWWMRVNGSSPRVRGTLIGSQISNLVFRFIPACAGNTLPLTHCELTTIWTSQNPPTD